MSYENIYYSPELFGLEILASEDDPHASYSFDMFVVWRDPATGELFYAQDSGCSCPSPFEGYNSKDDLTPYTDWATFVEDVEEWGRGYNGNVWEIEIHNLKKAVGEAT